MFIYDVYVRVHENMVLVGKKPLQFFVITLKLRRAVPTPYITLQYDCCSVNPGHLDTSSCKQVRTKRSYTVTTMYSTRQKKLSLSVPFNGRSV